MPERRKFPTLIRKLPLLGLLAWALCLGSGSQGWAQSTTELDAIYFKARQSSDEAQIRQALGQLQNALAKRPTASLRTQAGYLYLRLENPDSARTLFEQAILRDSTQVGAHTGLGWVLLEYKDSPRSALAHLEAAVAIDSTHAETLYYLARAYLRTSKTTRARRSADAAIRHNPSYAPPYLFLAKLYQKENNERAARTFFKKYLEQNPEDQTAAYDFAVDLIDRKQFKEAQEIAERMGGVKGLPILAQTLIEERDYEGALIALIRYINSLPPEEQAFYEDISLVGLPHEIRAYQSTTPETSEAFLRTFWLRKDPFKTSGGAMRRAEHYRRVWYARTFFGKKKFPYDRRGEVYIRYGEPDFQSAWNDLNAQIPLDVQRVQEKMAYQLYGEKSLSMTFVGPVYPIRTEQVSETSYSNSAYATTSQPLQTMDEASLGLERYKPISISGDWSSVPWSVWIYTDIDGGMEVSFTDDFHSGIYEFAPAPTLSGNDIRELNMQRDGPMRKMINQINMHSPAALIARIASKEPERYNFAALEPMDFYYEALSFRGENGTVDVQVNIGLPIDKVARPEDIDTTVVIERRVALIDGRAGKLAKRRDDLAIPISDESRSSNLMAMDRVDLQVTSGVYELAVEAWRKNTDMLQVYRQTVDLPNYHSDRLMLSDLQIAQRIVEIAEGAGSVFQRGTLDILPAPARTFREGEPLFVYFEIYNLSRDDFGNTRYEVSYEVRATASTDASGFTLMPRIRNRSGEAIEVRYEQIGTEESVADFVELDLGKANPGRYELRMVVKDLNNEKEATRESIFKISAPARR